jgi:hypothetical protein
MLRWPLQRKETWAFQGGHWTYVTTEPVKLRYAHLIRLFEAAVKSSLRCIEEEKAARL